MIARTLINGFFVLVLTFFMRACAQQPGVDDVLPTAFGGAEKNASSLHASVNDMRRMLGTVFYPKYPVEYFKSRFDNEVSDYKENEDYDYGRSCN